MKILIIGFLAGAILTLFCIVSFIEIIHIKVERVDVNASLCGYFSDIVSKTYGEDLQNYIKITYKIFAKPIKTILIYGVAKNTEVYQDWKEKNES